jgi:predicted nuclease with TOPRIM domain
MDYQSKVDNFGKTFENDKGSEETERLQNTLNELKSKLEELEVRNTFLNINKMLANLTVRLKNWNGAPR